MTRIVAIETKSYLCCPDSCHRPTKYPKWRRNICPRLEKKKIFYYRNYGENSAIFQLEDLERDLNDHTYSLLPCTFVNSENFSEISSKRCEFLSPSLTHRKLSLWSAEPGPGEGNKPHRIKVETSIPLKLVFDFHDFHLFFHSFCEMAFPFTEEMAI